MPCAHPVTSKPPESRCNVIQKRHAAESAVDAHAFRNHSAIQKICSPLVVPCTPSTTRISAQRHWTVHLAAASVGTNDQDVTSRAVRRLSCSRFSGFWVLFGVQSRYGVHVVSVVGCVRFNVVQGCHCPSLLAAWEFWGRLEFFKLFRFTDSGLLAQTVKMFTLSKLKIVLCVGGSLVGFWCCTTSVDSTRFMNFLVRNGFWVIQCFTLLFYKCFGVFRKSVVVIQTARSLERFLLRILWNQVGVPRLLVTSLNIQAPVSWEFGT